MAIDTNRTVGSIAAEIPGSTTVLEKLKIDYCCGGGSSIKDACLGAGVDPEELVRRIEEAGQADPEDQTMQQKTLAELVAYIVDKHHTFTRTELARVDELAAKVRAAHGQNHPETLKIEAIFQSLRQELTTHMLKEEQVLFPYITKMEEAVSSDKPVPTPFFGTVQNPVRMMMMEHDGAGEALREMRALSADYAVPSDGCATFQTLYHALQELEADLHRHIHLENNILFPRAIAMETSGGGRG